MERKVIRLSYEEAKPFILGVHYARRMPCVTDAFGLLKDGYLCGVVTYGVPASPSLCKGVAGEANRDRVRELNRLVVVDGERNDASYLVSHSLDMLQDGTFVVSYADAGAWGHVGYIYQATNFLYTGVTKERTDKYVEGGGIQGTMIPTRRGDNQDQQSTGICFWSGTGGARGTWQGN